MRRRFVLNVERTSRGQSWRAIVLRHAEIRQPIGATRKLTERAALGVIASRKLERAKRPGAKICPDR